MTAYGAGPAGGDTRWGINRIVGAAVGAGYLVVGLVGFFVTDQAAFAGRSGGSLLGLRINSLHNIVHLALGVGLLTAALRDVYAAKSANLLLGVVFLILGGLGLFAMNSRVNVLALNGADNGLHVVTGALLALVSLTRWDPREPET